MATLVSRSIVFDMVLLCFDIVVSPYHRARWFGSDAALFWSSVASGANNSAYTLAVRETSSDLTTVQGTGCFLEYAFLPILVSLHALQQPV